MILFVKRDASDKCATADHLMCVYIYRDNRECAIYHIYMYILGAHLACVYTAKAGPRLSSSIPFWTLPHSAARDWCVEANFMACVVGGQAERGGGKQEARP